MLTKKIYSIAFGTLVSLGLLFWACYQVSWGEVWHALEVASLWWFLPIIGMTTLHFVLRAVRWRVLLNQPQLSLRNLFDCIIIGGFATFILPLRAGEFVRPLVLSKIEPVPFPKGFATVVVERFFDLAAVLICFGLVMPHYLSAFPAWVWQGALGLAVIFGAVFGLMLFAAIIPGLSAKILGKATFLRKIIQAPIFQDRWRGLFKKIATQFLQGSEILNSPRRFIEATILTALVWLTCFWSFQLFFIMMQFQSTFQASVLVAVILALAVAAPSAPGFIGVFQVGCIAAFRLLGQSAEDGLAFSIVNHAFQYFILLSYGIFALVYHRIGFGEITSQKSAS